MNGVLVDRELMIRSELHHRHDVPEFGDEHPQDAEFVHSAERPFRISVLYQKVDKKLVGLWILPEGIVDKVQI